MIKITCKAPWVIIDYGEAIGEINTVDMAGLPNSTFKLVKQETTLADSIVDIYCDSTDSNTINNDNRFTVISEVAL
jgi:hypothetical protein